MATAHQIYGTSDLTRHPDGLGIKLDCVTITPAMAKYMLGKMGDTNRAIKDTHLPKIEADMREGRWLHRPNCICVNHDGIVVDGQHRLQALVNLGVSLPFFVALGVDSAEGIDEGSVRSEKDRLKVALQEEIHRDIVTIIHNLMLDYRTDKIRLGNEALRHCYEQHQASFDYALRYTHLRSYYKGSNFVPGVLVAVVRALAYPTAQVSVYEFMEELQPGMQNRAVATMSLSQYLSHVRGTSRRDILAVERNTEICITAFRKGRSILPQIADRATASKMETLFPI